MGSAAVAFWALSTLVLLATAVLIVAINYVAHKEYTEEIDRLRRDLLAARERNGVYIALENYNEMTKQLELNRQEINEKLQLIKTLEKEKGDMQGLCTELNISLKEKKDNLIESQNTLKLAAETVEEQLERERELTETARSILVAANDSTADILKLHDKLDRKRSVEEINSRISQDFRKEFNKKVTHLQDNVADFVSRSSTFLNEMKKEIDGSLQKRNSELSVLSEDLVASVKSLTNILQTWSKKASEQTLYARQNVQKFLEDARGLTDTETNIVHTFLTQTFLPLTQNFQHQIQRLKAENEGFSRLVNEQAIRNSEIVATFARTQGEALTHFKQTNIFHLQKVDQVSEKLYRDQKKRAEAIEKYSEKLASSVQKVIENAKNCEQIYQEYMLEDKTAKSNLDENLQLIQQNAEKALLVTNAAFETEERRIKDLCSNVEVQSEETTDMVKGFLERVSSVTNGIEECHDETETVVRKSVSATEEAWANHYSYLEQQMRHISQNIHDLEKHHQENTQLLTGCLHKSAQSHEAHLEEQRMGYSSFVRDHILSLEEQCTHTSTWGHNIDNYIRERDNDVEVLLTELLQQDMPTGQTPQRREYSYPTALLSSSSSRIMEKFKKINEVAQLRDLMDQAIPEGSEDNSGSRDTIFSDNQSDNGRTTPINTASNEDDSEVGRDKSPDSILIAGEPQFETDRPHRSNLRVSRSSEDVNKENSRPADDQEKTKILKSVSLNDIKVTPRRALNTKN